METLIKDAISKFSGPYAEVRVEESSGTAVRFQGQEIEEAAERTGLGGCVRVYDAGGWGFCSFNNIDKIDHYLMVAAQNAKKAAKGRAPFPSDRKIVDLRKTAVKEDPFSVPLSEKVSLCESYQNIILSGKKIVTGNVRYGDLKKKTIFCNSFGSYIEQEQVYSGVSMFAIAKDGDNVQQGYRSFGETCGYEVVRGQEAEAVKAVKEAEDLLNARKVEGGRYTVILDPKLAGVFTHEAFGHLSEADFIFDNPRMAEKMKIGTVFGPDNLNIVDDATIEGARGSYYYDDEGVPAQKTYLIKNGKLAGHIHSRESADRMGEPLTGNARAISYRYSPIVRMSCTFIEPGAQSFDNMISGIDDGIYACGMLGGNTDLEMFTFSAEKAYRIKNGKVSDLLRDVVLSGNVFETLHNIDAIGNDFKLFGGMGGCGKGGQSPLPVSDGGPHIRIKNVLIG